ncbi:hypothetical protein CEXT_514731 [Caerostris extrusa]|uniref:Uncharacterized protein n=1 Tax=Caerostris extrusa TaxID=172846 RepID=A0AAV4TFC1_CAEEX|nr:hypothetical protein CEXT_514731 [Caerostris extrusa]
MNSPFQTRTTIMPIFSETIEAYWLQDPEPFVYLPKHAPRRIQSELEVLFLFSVGLLSQELRSSCDSSYSQLFQANRLTMQVARCK